jgi:hypothetical protein
MDQFISGVFTQLEFNSRNRLKDLYLRPRNIDANLATAISNDTHAHSQIHNAIQDPKLVMISDWFHQTSEELRNIALAADIDAL